MPQTCWSAEAWLVIHVEFRRALALRSEIRRATRMSAIEDVNAPSSRRVASGSMTLLDDLDAFYLEHESCGDLDSAVEGDRVCMACTCGAVISRRVDDD
jgi:hypothetical protein